VTESAVIPAPSSGAAIAEQVAIKGDLSKLTEQQRMDYYTAVCASLGLNPLTRPFEYITLNGKLTLYARKDATEQLRKLARVTTSRLDKEQVGDLFVVTAYGRTPDGREDASTGAVATRGLVGEALANAMMKAETKAKRRLTLSLVGLGFPTEEEIEDLPAAEPPVERKTLAERVAEKAAEIAPTTPAEAMAKTPEEAAADVAVKRAARVAEEAPIEGEFTPEEIVEAVDHGPALCGWKLAAKGGAIVPCSHADGHDGDHSWDAIARSAGGRVVRPEA
jgi:hypothetical protein